MKSQNKNKLTFSRKDLRQMALLGFNPEAVKTQLSLYRRGANFLKLNRPCTVGDGILSITPAQRKKLISFYDKTVEKYKVMKFVPASGAASRMFTHWFAAAGQGSFGSNELDKLFFTNLERLPFFNVIEKGFLSGQGRGSGQSIGNVLNYILFSEGLNFGKFPKALIPFHRYASGEMRTPMEEHICEAAQYIRDKNNTCSIHFTLAPGFKKEMVNYLKEVLPFYEKNYRVKFKINYSTQELSTNTIAVDRNNIPLRNADGEIIFRPGGHGTLLGNLNKLNADFIFVKNIDNVAPDSLSEKIVPYRKMMGGLAMKIQEEIFANIKLLSGGAGIPEMDKVMDFCSRNLNIVFPPGFKSQSRQEKITFLISLLNRPLRICGVVENNKEPGGGPFWVNEIDGNRTLQMVEGAHVDKGKKIQQLIWSRAGYFNPVDMVCCIKDYRGRKFNLFEFVDQKAYLISIKNEKGREIKALEVPGLWNGSMAYWNTIFVKLPLMVFNPVKTVDDLLRPQHLSS